jgi:hypothetical protein
MVVALFLLHEARSKHRQFMRTHNFPMKRKGASEIDTADMLQREYRFLFSQQKVKGNYRADQ